MIISLKNIDVVIKLQEIQQSIERLQVDSRSAVQAMDKGGQQVNACVDKAAEAGRSLAKITTVVETINDMNTQIASAAEEQSTVFSDISQNIERISKKAKVIAKGGVETANEGLHLETLSKEMVKLVGYFSLDTERAQCALKQKG